MIFNMNSNKQFPQKRLLFALLVLANNARLSESDAENVYSTLSYMSTFFGPNGYEDLVQNIKALPGQQREYNGYMSKYFKPYSPKMMLMSTMEVHSILYSYNKKVYHNLINSYLTTNIESLVAGESLNSSRLFIEFVTDMLRLDCVAEPGIRPESFPIVYKFIQGWVAISETDFVKIVKNYLLSFTPLDNSHIKASLMELWYGKIEELVSNSVYLNRVSKMVAKELIIPDFEIKRVKYNKTILFSNGLYDLTTKEFKEIMPHHLQEQGLPFDYHILGSDLELEQELDDHLKSFFPNGEKLEYVLHAFAKCLSGTNDDKKIWFLIGPSNGGKTKFMNLINYTFGKYSVVLPPQFFNSSARRSPSDANPAMTMTIGKLVGIIQEPPQGGFNIEQMKHSSGETVFTTRKLYKEYSKTSYDLTIRYFISANMTDINSFDAAFWRRAVRIDFESVFLPDNERDEKIKFINDNFYTKEYANIRKFDTIEQELALYPRQDPNIDIKNQRLAPVLLSKLIHYYHNQKDLNVDFPSVDKSSKLFRAQNDPVLRYSIENIVKVQDSAPVLLKYLYEHFKEWYKREMPNRRVVEVGRFSECLQQLGYMVGDDPKKGKLIYHIRIKTYSDKDEEDNNDDLHFDY